MLCTSGAASCAMASGATDRAAGKAAGEANGDTAGEANGDTAGEAKADTAGEANDNATGDAIGRAIVATERRLAQHGFKANFVAPSTASTAKAIGYIDAIAGVKGAMDHVSELSYHRYHKATAANVNAIARKGEKFGKPTSMLELWFGRADSRVLFEDLTVGNASAFQGRTLFGHFDVNRTETGAISVNYRKEVAENRQVFKYVHDKAVRIEAHAAQKSATPVAFINPDGAMIVAIRTSGPMQLTFAGLKPGDYEISYASGKQIVSTARHLTVGDDGKGEATMPAAGVMTIAGVVPHAANRK